MHKRVCGTNPFETPRFSAKELEQLNEVKALPVQDPAALGKTNSLEHIIARQVVGDDPVMLERHRGALFERFLENAQGPKNGTPRLESLDALQTVRSSSWKIALTRSGFLDTPDGSPEIFDELAKERPFDILAKVSLMKGTTLCYRYSGQESWFSELHHLLVNFIAIAIVFNQRAYGSEELAKEYSDYVVHAMQEILFVCADQVDKVSPRKALEIKTIVDDILGLFRLPVRLSKPADDEGGLLWAHSEIKSKKRATQP